MQSRADRFPGRRGLACFVRVTHDHFRFCLDAQSGNRWFVVKLEFKLVGP